MGNSIGIENWELLRESDDYNFAIEHTKEMWEAGCRESKNTQAIAKKIISNIDISLKNWISFGIGKGVLEWNITNLDSSIHLCGTDYTKNSIELLKSYFGDKAQLFWFDMLSYNEYENLKGFEVAIVFRLSTEFTKKQWRRIFDSLYETSIRKIVFIPTEILTLDIAIREFVSHISHIIVRKRDVFCGYMYTQREFESLFGKWRVDKYLDEDKLWILGRE